jgi:hypothetical protein
MKKILLSMMMALLLVLAVGCSNSAESSGESPVEPESEIGGDLQTAAIVFDFSAGSPEENLRRETENSYEEITPEDLAVSLSSISGLDFFVTVSDRDDGGLLVDWAADSTLIANLDDREQKEDFHFFDADSMRWFMMDSMWRTLTENYGVDIYYTMDGGKELAFEELYPQSSFASDTPYKGSAYYFAEGDAQG